MFLRLLNLLSQFLFVFFLLNLNLYAEVIDNIKISGNNRISKATILMFSDIKENQNIQTQDLNEIIKKLYDSNFFENVSVNFENGNLLITVVENPVIEKIIIEGIKSNTIKDDIYKNLILKDRSSFNTFDLEKDKSNIILNLKNRGYYKTSVDVFKNIKNDNIIDLTYTIDLGEKAKIKRIYFTGDKVYKDSKLKSLILSEEYKPWKFISGRKYLNENTIKIDNKLLRNFYLNKGFYDVKINSSFAKLINKDNFELIFNIQSGKKFYLNNLKLNIPVDFNKENFASVENLFNKLKGKPYSINRIEKILNSIDTITANEQYLSIKSTVDEEIDGEKINLTFSISEIEKVFVEKINIFGNNVTQESVIRNQFEIDEGDPFNEILFKKSINNMQSLGFFKTVNYNIKENTQEMTRIINLTVEEKPTGEIMAGAGFGTGGTTTTFGVKENNYLGRGIAVDGKLDLSETSIKGKLSINNKNFKNTDKSINSNIQAIETDKLSEFGYKTNKTGISLGTNFELYDDLNFGLGASSFYEKIETDSSASARQKEQEGDYFDNFVTLTFDYDKRNQRFQTSEGFRNYLSTEIPIISETNTLSNTFVATKYIEYLDQNIFKSSFYFKNANSLTGDNIKLSERLVIPSSRLRGFEFGKVGPKDGNDYIGGNFISTLNFTTTVNKILENSQSTDFNLFVDIASIWGVDYDSSLSNSDDIRSSIGIGLDWFSPIGPMNFSLTQPITKNENDVTETFRFNLGTTF